MPASSGPGSQENRKKSSITAGSPRPSQLDRPPQFTVIFRVLKFKGAFSNVRQTAARFGLWGPGSRSLGTRLSLCFNAVMNEVPHRYRKQVLFDPIGREG